MKTVARRPQLLDWADDDHVYYRAGSTLEMLNLASSAPRPAPAVGSGEWQVPSPAGPLARPRRRRRRRAGSPPRTGTTTLLDLSSD